MRYRLFITDILFFSPLLSFCTSQTQAGPLPSSDDKFFQFVSRPDIGAPKWNIEVSHEDGLAPGYWFLAPYASLTQTEFPLWNGPHIYDGHGDLIWSGTPFFQHYNTFDFQTAQVAGKQMLSVIIPHDQPGSKVHITFGDEVNGSGVILDDSYKVYRTINMRGDVPKVNMHDLTITDNGKRALMLTQKTYEPTPIHIGFFNGPCKVGWQGFRELDLETGETVFEWDARGHITVQESTRKEASIADMCKDDWDILHLNSIDKFEDGDYLISARHADTIYKVSHKDGSIVWRLGGLKSDFQFQDEQATFTRQHHSKIYSSNETHTMISLFNNAKGSGTGPSERPSSPESAGLLLALRTDVSPMTADLVRRYGHPDGLHSESRGSVSFLQNGNVFIDWVGSSLITEHTFDGRLLLKAHLNVHAHTYRAYKSSWAGRPSQPPDVHSTAVDGREGRLNTLVHVSWNGATEVASWELLHINVPSNASQTIASSPRQGFETALSYDGFAEYVAVIALDRSGKEIGRSKNIKTSISTDALSISVAEEAQWQQNQVGRLNMKTLVSSSIVGYAVVAFVLGFVCCFVGGAGIWLLLRFRASSTEKKIVWWRSSYKPVMQSDDDEIEHDEPKSNGKEVT